VGQNKLENLINELRKKKGCEKANPQRFIISYPVFDGVDMQTIKETTFGSEQHKYVVGQMKALKQAILRK